MYACRVGLPLLCAIQQALTVCDRSSAQLFVNAFFHALPLCSIGLATLPTVNHRQSAGTPLTIMALLLNVSPKVLALALNDHLPFLRCLAAPARSRLGLFIMLAHAGMCRSAATGLYERPQCGHGTSSCPQGLISFQRACTTQHALLGMHARCVTSSPTADGPHNDAYLACMPACMQWTALPPHLLCLRHEGRRRLVAAGAAARGAHGQAQLRALCLPLADIAGRWLLSSMSAHPSLHCCCKHLFASARLHLPAAQSQTRDWLEYSLEEFCMSMEHMGRQPAMNLGLALSVNSPPVLLPGGCSTPTLVVLPGTDAPCGGPLATNGTLLLDLGGGPCCRLRGIGTWLSGMLGSSLPLVAVLSA